MPSSSEATWHYELFATLLHGSANSCQNSTLPAAASVKNVNVKVLFITTRVPFLILCEMLMLRI